MNRNAGDILYKMLFFNCDKPNIIKTIIENVVEMKRRIPSSNVLLIIS